MINLNHLDELKNHLIILVSDSVLDEYLNYLDLLNNPTPDTSEISEQAQQLITAIRQM